MEDQPRGESSIQIYHLSLPSPLPTAPSFKFNLTRLRDTLFIWVGAGPPSATGGIPGLEDESGGGWEKRLASDWAVAIPSRRNIPVTSTSLFRSPSDIAQSWSLRLAKRFPTNQIHLSLSLPDNLLSGGLGGGSGTADPLIRKVMLVVEKRLVDWIEKTIN